MEARLDDRSRGLLHDIVFADEVEDGMSDVERAEACLTAMADTNTEAQRRRDVRRRIKEAERTGDFEQAMNLTRELEKRRS